MTERLLLNHMNKFHPDNVKRIVRKIGKRPSKSFNTKITDGFLLSCRIEPELYLKIQDAVKKVTGKYIPMDELIHHLLTYFCYVYGLEEPINILPYQHVHKGKSRHKLNKFERRFGKYYKNSVRSFKD